MNECCPHCRAEQSYAGLCHRCFFAFSSGDPWPRKIVQAAERWASGAKPLQRDLFDQRPP